jgi:hypothetical protein
MKVWRYWTWTSRPLTHTLFDFGSEKSIMHGIFFLFCIRFGFGHPRSDPYRQPITSIRNALLFFSSKEFNADMDRATRYGASFFLYADLKYLF